MSNLIILEGPDGSGKSVLFEELKRRDYGFMKFSVPPAAARRSEESLFQFFFEPLYLSGENEGPTVLDRLHLSDRIYGPLMRGGTPMTYRAEALLERYVEARDGQIVICLPPYRVAFANWLARKGQEYVTQAATYRQVYEGYVRLLFNVKRNRHFLWYDYTRHQVARFAEALVKLRGNPLPAGVVGSQHPRFLIVGEQANTPYDLPFMTTRGCSGWLFDVLAEAGYQEPELAFINALDKQGRVVGDWGTPALAKARPTFICLGEKATAWADWKRDTFHHLPHPQYCKRFKAKERAAYVAALAKIRRQAP